MKSCCGQTTAVPLRVLLVDDEPGDAVVMEAFLEMQEGFQCVGCASNGEDALKFLSRQDSPVDAVLLDVYMPGMDGIDFLREWQKLPSPKPKVFVLSAYGAFGEEQIRHQVLRLGVAAYFEKGYPLDLICKRMRDLCACRHTETFASSEREGVLEELAEELVDDLLPATKSVGRYYLMALFDLYSTAHMAYLRSVRLDCGKERRVVQIGGPCLAPDRQGDGASFGQALAAYDGRYALERRCTVKQNFIGNAEKRGFVSGASLGRQPWEGGASL